ncbi:MAG: methyltransferase domain-containing protein, partial [Endozoicomonadaceae bacterium]|nr:methyltransferase domain-containing protein [Endozoicomonadaceae bacterium]
IEMLNICAEKMKSTDKKNISFINCNIDLLEDNIDKKADVIVCSSVLEYLDNLDESLTMIMKSMNNNGVFIFSMPNKQSFYRRIEPVSFSLVGFPKYYKHVRNICTPTEMRERLERIGFSIVESEYYAKTPFLSKIFRKIGMPYYADNLFIMVAKLSP